LEEVGNRIGVFIDIEENSLTKLNRSIIIKMLVEIFLREGLPKVVQFESETLYSKIGA
jgi:hypothetical protein